MIVDRLQFVHRATGMGYLGCGNIILFLESGLFVAFCVFSAKIQTALAIGAGVGGSLGGLAYTVYGVLLLEFDLLVVVGTVEDGEAPGHCLEARALG